MRARLHWWLHEWDWRPLVRAVIWIGIAVAWAKQVGYQPPSAKAIARELVLGWLLTFGLLTQLQLWLAAGAIRSLMTVDDWTYAAAESIVGPVAGRARFATKFIVVFSVQIALVLLAIKVLPLAIESTLRRL